MKHFLFLHIIIELQTNLTGPQYNLLIMFGNNPVILYSSLKQTEGFVQVNSILGGVRSSDYKFARANGSESGRVEQTARMAQANNSLEGVYSSGYEFARTNYFKSGRVERRKVEARATKVL